MRYMLANSVATINTVTSPPPFSSFLLLSLFLSYSLLSLLLCLLFEVLDQVKTFIWGGSKMLGVKHIWGKKTFWVENILGQTLLG